MRKFLSAIEDFVMALSLSFTDCKILSSFDENVVVAYGDLTGQQDDVGLSIKCICVGK